MFPFGFVLAVVLTAVRLSCCSVVKQSAIADQHISNLIIDELLLFQSPAVSAQHCAIKCFQDNGCLTFTFTEKDESGPGKCRGHGQVNTSSAVTKPQPMTTMFALSADDKPPATHVQLEAEDGTGFPSNRIRTRGNASGGMTVKLFAADDNVTATICLPGRDQVKVQAVRFSMDSPLQKVVSVFVDSLQVGTFIADDNSKGCHGWDVFTTTTTPFRPLYVGGGQHALHVVLQSAHDIYGIEIDALLIGFGSDLSHRDLVCP